MVVAKDDRSPLAAWRRFDRPNRASLRVTLTSLRNELAGGRKKITTIPRSLRSELVGPVAGARLKYSKKETLSLSLSFRLYFILSIEEETRKTFETGNEWTSCSRYLQTRPRTSTQRTSRRLFNGPPATPIIFVVVDRRNVLSFILDERDSPLTEGRRRLRSRN